MILGLWQLACGLWARIGRIVGGIGTWLRAPHDWWKIGFCSAGSVAMLAAFVAWDARKTILIVREQCAIDLAKKEIAVEEARAASEVSNAAVQQCATRLQTEVGKRQEIERIAREAVAQAKRRHDKAESALKAWQGKYAKRPAGCAEALKQVEAQCAVVSDY